MPKPRAAFSTPREAESAVLTKAAQRLQMVRDDWANQSGELVAALNFNQKVWTILATAATDTTNRSPRRCEAGAWPIWPSMCSGR